VPAILGIDAAWTESGSSGIALLRDDSRGWNCISAEQSYAHFMRRAGLASEGIKGALPNTISNPDALLSAANNLLGGNKVDVVAVDIPVANVPILGRRVADNTISSEFGANWCGTHSPSRKRPGKVGTRIGGGFCKLGYHLATAETPAGDTPKLIEVFPHVALLRMLGVSSRVTYKVAKSRKYWPKDSLEVRKERLLIEFAKILEVLKREICGISLELPTPAKVKFLSSLKPFEDVIDAIVCAWVGVNYLRKKARPYGDHSAAIWVPDPRN
jgi:predicted RNase H-like nuclease